MFSHGGLGGERNGLAADAPGVDDVDIVKFEILRVHAQSGGFVVVGLRFLALAGEDGDLVAFVRGHVFGVAVDG